MRAGFQITTEQGSTRIDVTLAEFMRLARQNNTTVAQVVDQANDIETWVEMLWWAATRTGQTTLSLDDFAASIVDVERVPTGDPKSMSQGAGNTSSSGSKSTRAATGAKTPPKTS